MSDNAKRYLAEFTRKAIAAGLDMASPGQNWAPMRPLVKGSHISLSVRKNQIQVNLNNDDDADRHKYLKLYADREGLNSAIGMPLVWEQKDGRKKTAIRATLEKGYEDPDWEAQHRWAVETMQAFVTEFGPRLGG